MMAVTSSSSSSRERDRERDSKGGDQQGKYVRYTTEQVEALERLYHDCPKPSSLRRQQLIRDCPILSNIEPKQIKVWFQNRRCREKQRKESSRLQAVNRKLNAMNKLLMEENDRLQKQVSQLIYENGCFRQQLHNASIATTTDNNSCESAVTSSQQQQQQAARQSTRDATPAGLLSIAEETLKEFLSKAKGNAVDWIQMPGMKPGPDAIGIVNISHGATGVAARVCALVCMEPTKVVEILKDRPSWLRDCRCLDVLHAFSTGNGGTIELLYSQMYALTTLASARDFFTLRYTSVLEDGSLVVCERSLSGSQGGPSIPSVQHFVRASMLSSGYLVRPCEGGSSLINIVDHFDLEPWSVPEVLRPLYESSVVLAQRITMTGLRHLRQISQEVSSDMVHGWGRQPSSLRTFSQRLCKGFNDAVNGFQDDGWSLLAGDGVDDVTVLVNSSPSKVLGLQVPSTDGFPTLCEGVLCAKASMLLQNIPPALLVRFLRAHRSEWAESNIDAYSAAALKAIPSSRIGGGQVVVPLAHTVENEEFLEVIRLENNGITQEEALLSRDAFLLQLCTGTDENAAGSCAELVFAPVDASLSDNSPLLPSGFRVIPLDPGMDASSPNHTLDLASTLEVGSAAAKTSADHDGNSSVRSVLIIAFQFMFENHLREHVASMARQYVRSVVTSVQRAAMVLAPSRMGSHLGLRSLPGTPEALTLARWIYQSYRFHMGVELFRANSDVNESLLKTLWHHSDAILCCSLTSMPVFTFANQSGLDMLETTLVALQDISLEKILDESGRKSLCSDFAQIMQQGYAQLSSGVCVSSMGRPVAYDRAIAWKVLNEEETPHCIAFMFMNWSFA